MKKALSELRALFTPRTAAELARDELEGAERDLLKAQSGREYAEAMVNYHQRRISRLRITIASLQQPANDSTANPDALRRVA